MNRSVAFGQLVSIEFRSTHRYISAYATLSSGDVDLCLIPEVAIYNRRLIRVAKFPMACVAIIFKLFCIIVFVIKYLHWETRQT